MKTITTNPNQSLVFVVFLAPAPGRNTTPHKKIERAYPSQIREKSCAL
jgi:hypothetical protein